MSSAFPSSPSLPIVNGDDLATVVVRRLERRPTPGSWGLMKTVLLGVPSFGLLPLLAWPARFRDYVAEETQAMQELAQWAKLRGRQPAAVGPLSAAAEETAIGPFPFILALLIAAAVIGVFTIQFAQPSVQFCIDDLLNWTYTIDSRFLAPPLLAHRDFAHNFWVIALSIGYGVQWVHIRTHAATVKRFIERFNPVIEAEGLPPVRLRNRGHAYFAPVWILAAVILCLYSAWWGIPMVLAGMAQRRYTNVTGRVVRHELAKRVRDVVTLRSSAATYPPAVSQRCENPRCLAPIRERSRFCARCGSATESSR